MAITRKNAALMVARAKKRMDDFHALDSEMMGATMEWHYHNDEIWEYPAPLLEDVFKALCAANKVLNTGKKGGNV